MAVKKERKTRKDKGKKRGPRDSSWAALPFHREEEAREKKARKERKDKGKKRGPRVKKESKVKKEKKEPRKRKSEVSALQWRKSIWFDSWKVGRSKLAKEYRRATRSAEKAKIAGEAWRSETKGKDGRVRSSPRSLAIREINHESRVEGARKNSWVRHVKKTASEGNYTGKTGKKNTLFKDAQATYEYKYGAPRAPSRRTRQQAADQNTWLKHMKAVSKEHKYKNGPELARAASKTYHERSGYRIKTEESGSKKYDVEVLKGGGGPPTLRIHQHGSDKTFDIKEEVRRPPRISQRRS
jgi:hypothetical protein